LVGLIGSLGLEKDTQDTRTYLSTRLSHRI
jgi:hypothetical protein